MRSPILVGLVAAICTQGALAAPVKHPNLLLNREEIAQIREKIAKYPWAAQLFEKVKEATNPPAGWWINPFGGRQVRARALCYVLTGERAYADAVRADLLGQARNDIPRWEGQDLSVPTFPGFNIWQGSWDTYAWAYDLTYDTFSAEERETVERWLRLAGKILIDDYNRMPTTPNLMFVMHYNAGIVGYCLGDQELIDWALSDLGKHGPRRGGFYPTMDTMITDKLFWAEAPLYGLEVDLHGILALAEAALHYDGTDLYHYVSKSGASIKGLLDGYLAMGFPREDTGVRGGALRVATFGDGSMSYGPTGTSRDVFLTDNLFMADLEIGYKRYKDPGYAWVLSLNPARDATDDTARAPIWGYLALTHGEPLPANPAPPPAPSGVYPQQGFAMLRAEESPTYWTQPSLAAMYKLGTGIGHGHPDYYQMVLHGKGRLLYPDIQAMTYEPSFLGWSREGIGHNTLIVDGKSPRSNPFTAVQDFTPEIKFVASAGSAFEGVTQTRRLLLTKEYLADVFHAADGSGAARTFDWVLHGLGRLYPANPGAYLPTRDLDAYRWVHNERGRTVDGTWQADWIQRTAGINPALQYGPEWFDHEVGVRMTMLGVPGTQAYCGDGPLTNGPPFDAIDGEPEGTAPMVVVRRQAPAATYVAVHEPYEGAPQIKQVSRLAETPEAVVLVVTGADYTDYLMTAFDDQAHTVTAPSGEAFTFTDYGYLRLAQGQIVARGRLAAFRLRAEVAGTAATATVNDRARPLRRDGGFVLMGRLPDALPLAAAVAKDDPAERATALHYYCLPAEVHLSAEKAGDTREVQVHLRAVGPGQVVGALQVSAPEGVTVTPAQIEVAPLREGEERIVTFTVKAGDKVAKGLYPISFAPVGMRAARQELVASVGVVIAIDRSIPGMMQYLVRAPGYTMKVDANSGVSFYLLDADGHRRHGTVYNSNFQFGIPSVEGSTQFGKAGKVVWEEGTNALQISSDAAHLLYTFYEDRMVFKVVPPTDPTKTFTMWMGTFDYLGDPIHKGKQDQPWLPITANWIFFPHPTYRQGVLLIPPPDTPVTDRRGSHAVDFPVREGQQVTLKFATKEEVDQLD